MNRRRLLLLTQGWMVAVAAVLGVLTLGGVVTPWLLLAFTFALGLGAAMNAPAWQAITPELVSREELPAAVALSSVGINLARAIGPARDGSGRHRLRWSTGVSRRGGNRWRGHLASSATAADG